MKQLFTTILCMLLCLSASAEKVEYQKITNASNLADGDRIILVNETAKKASGAITNSKYFATVDLTISGDKATAENAQEITFNGTPANCTLTTAGNQKLGCTGTSNDLTFDGKKNTSWAITIGTTTLVQNTGVTAYQIQYNASGTGRFTVYKGTMTPITVWKRIRSLNPSDTIPTNPTDTTNTKPTDTIPNPEVKADTLTYNLVQSLDYLQDGDTVFFAPNRANTNYVLGLYDKDIASSNIRAKAAEFGENRRTVTALSTYAYIVKVAGDKYQFVGSDGKYLYMYNTNKNLSSSEDGSSNQSKWTVSIKDDVATIKSVYSSTWTMLYNHTAANPLFCTYSNIDANVDLLLLYSSSAPAYKEKVLEPEMTITYNGTELTDELDWGEVVYDNSWGTEVEPYNESRSITITAKDLSNPIRLTLAKKTAFSVSQDSLILKNGAYNNSVSISFITSKEGTYVDTLTISSGTISKRIILRAKAVREASPSGNQPKLTVSVSDVKFKFAMTEKNTDLIGFTFSAENLAKTLYVEWEKNGMEPTVGRGKIEMLVGDWYINPGEKAQFSAPTVEETDVLIDVKAYSAFTYATTIHFTSLKEGSKTDLAIDVQIPFEINVTYTPQPTGISNPSDAAKGTKLLRDGKISIRLGEREFCIEGKQIK